jgi:hypothetical protein
MDNSRTFQLEQGQIQRLTAKLPPIPWEDFGPLLDAQMEVHGVSLRLVYHPVLFTLAVTILSKPVNVSTNRLWNEIENYLQKGDSA